MARSYIRKRAAWIQRSILVCSTGSGMMPSPSTSSWKARRSKRAAELAFGVLAQALDLERAGHVGERLPGPGDVALDLGRRIGLGHRRVVEEMADCLLAAPAFRVQPGVDHQAVGAEQPAVQETDVLQRILEQAHVAAQRFGVKRPAFAERRDVAKALEIGQVFRLGRDGDLEMVAGRCFVQRQRHGLVGRDARQVVGVQVEHAGTRASGVRALIAGSGGARGAEGLDRAYLVIGFRYAAEQRRQLPCDVFLHGAVGRERGIGRGVQVGLAGAQVLEELRERALEAHAHAHLAEFGVQQRDLLQPGAVYVVGGQRQRGVGADVERVPVRAVGQRGTADAHARRGQVLVAHEGVQLAVGGHDAGRDQFAVHRLQRIAPGTGCEPADRPPEHALPRIVDDVDLELRQQATREHARQHHACGDAAAHVRYRRVDPVRPAGGAREPGLVVGGVREGLHAAARAQLRQFQVQAAELADGHQPAFLTHTREGGIRTANDRPPHASAATRRMMTNRWSPGPISATASPPPPQCAVVRAYLGGYRTLVRGGGLACRGADRLEGREELLLPGAGTAQRHLHAPHAHRDHGADLQQTKPDAVGPRPRELRLR